MHGVACFASRLIAYYQILYRPPIIDPYTSKLSKVDNDFHPAKRILKQRRVGGQNEYLVKWTGNYPSEWVREADVSKPLLDAFRIRHTKTGATRAQFKRSNTKR